MIFQPDYTRVLDTANRRVFADVLPKERCRVLEFGPSSKAAPRDCCADFAYVIACDGTTDTWECPFCGATWEAPCR